MKTLNPKVDHYLAEGCGRCPLVGTPECKVNDWREELKRLRKIILDCGLVEELKWSMPCYTFEKNNVLLLAALKEYCAVGFFKGSLLKDAKGVLVAPGENTQAARQIRFTGVREVVEMESTVKSYIREAIELEKAGAKVHFKKNPEPIPEELQDKLDELPALKAAFNALTPGRQRGYILFFSAPKQSKTRTARVEKCTRQILNGKGLND